MSLIEINQISKTYNTTAVPVEALKKIDLKFETKEFAAIVGPSGSGKTTLLNILGGLDEPSNGSVKIEDKVITEMSSGGLVDFRLNHIGFVFQAYNLIPVLTTLENVEFIMLLQGISKKERQERARMLLSDVGLSDKLDVRPAQLSGGQQQRVAVARALASHPDFVLADEPTANLDTESADALLDLMEELNEKFNMTFIFSTHDQRVIKRARRVITLQDGKIKSDA